MLRKMLPLTLLFGSNDPTYRFLPLPDNIKSQSSINLKIVEWADHNFKNMENEFKSLFVKFVEDNSKYQNNTIWLFLPKTTDSSQTWSCCFIL